MSSGAIERLEEMISEEQSASSEYIELAEDLLEEGIPKSEAVKLLKIASDEERHFEILKSILRKVD